MTPMNAALLAAALLFALFVVAQGLLPIFGRRASRATSAAMSQAIARGSDSTRPAEERAAAFGEAASLALDELGRPRLAARYAAWALREHPADPATIRLAARAMTRARRLRALERLLWRTLDARTEPSAQEAALEALSALYEGPLRAPERARVLARLRPSPPA